MDRRQSVRFRRKIVRPAIEHQPANRQQRHQLFRNQLGGVEVIEGKLVGLLLGEQLHGEFPLGETAGADGLEQVAAMEIGVGPSDLAGFVPEGRLQS
nr:hypothetical protein [Chromobacterium vaccinii]